jgi:trans-aconitate methyltransferase
MSYVPADYWGERGKYYEAEAIERGWVNVENEPLFRLLDTLEFSSVLEVGCGFGRVGAALKRHYPHIAYTGLDVSVDLIMAAQKRIGDGQFIATDVATWDTDEKWDLVVAVSVLGHILPADIEVVIAKMRKWANNDVVAIDWDEVGASTSFQFGHDFGHLYGDALRSLTPYGRQSVFHVKPLGVD